ncbi:DUF5050 domain-containing protein [Clostridium magnum]|uniref:DUF5050 domain-containing protein n=1 Tax=Clostridium magnum TaxID=33954 RepID=UPI003BFA71C8
MAYNPTSTNYITFTIRTISSINIYNDYIYYTVTEFGGIPEQTGLFKVKLDGSENTGLTDHVARYLWTVPGWVYFDSKTNY